MSGAWILLAAVGTGSAAAWVAHWRQKVADMLDDPSPAEAAEERRYDRDRYVELPGYPQPDPGPDIRYAVYPDGVLGDHPEPAPDIPGRMSLEDTTDAVRAAIRIAREAAGRREVER